MGHTSKFTFPLPGRKQRPPQITTISGPLNKAQKILGATEINIDSSTHLKEQQLHQLQPPTPSPKHWETMSNSATSGISISVSESTNSHADGEVGLGIIHKELADRSNQWEDESAIIPPHLNGPLHLTAGRGPNDYMTETASLRHRQSNSTINSYYDKSKQPLSVSQQTSNSAMAKGLPQEIQALPDTGGETTVKGWSKKQLAKLDMSFAHLLPKSRSSTRHVDAALTKGLVLGPDMVTTSPSAISISPEMTPPLLRGEEEMSSPGRSNDEHSRRILPRSKFRRQAPASFDAAQESRDRAESGRLLARKSSARVLESLYEHYERRTMQEVLEEEELERLAAVGAVAGSGPGQQVLDYPTPPTSSSTHAMLSPAPQVAGRGSYFNRPSSLVTAPDTPTGSAINSLGPHSATTDCSASVSSRYTHTSKASKHTDPSMTDFDLQKTSVLSLSSDSEDDFVEPQPPTSLSVSRRSSEAQGSPKSSRSAASRVQDAWSNAGQSPEKQRDPAHSQPYLTIPQANSGASLPKIGPRKSSLALSAVATSSHLPAALHMSSKLSSLTHPDSRATAANAARNISPSTRNVRESHSSSGKHSRAINMFPATRDGGHRLSLRPSASLDALNARAAEQANLHHPISQPLSSHRTSDQLTPPLSPTSMDFYLQSQRASVASGMQDALSIRSNVSAGAGSRRRSSMSSSSNAALQSGRFMAVTRQEELLLAALRIKRARMRENMIAEFDEGEEDEDGHEDEDEDEHEHELRDEADGQPAVKDDVLKQLQQQHQQHQRQQTQDSIGTVGSVSTIGPVGIHGTKTSRHSSVSTVVAMNPHPHPHPQIHVSKDSMAPHSKYLRGETPTPTSTRTALGPPPRPPRSRDGKDAGSSFGADRMSTEDGQILVMLDRPVQGVNAFDMAEPSPDLSDFLEFDDSATATMSDGFWSPALRSQSELARSSTSSVTEGADSTSSAPGAGQAEAKKSKRHPSPGSEQRLSLSAFPAPLRGKPSLTRLGGLSGRDSRTESRAESRAESPYSLNLFPARPKKGSSPAPSVTSLTQARPSPPPRKPLPIPKKRREDNMRARARESPEYDEDDEGEDSDGVPRPDSPISPPLAIAVAPPLQQKGKKNAELRLSAVGGRIEEVFKEAGWWDEDG